MIPSPSSPRSTTTDVAPSLAIRRAASRIVVSGEQSTSGARSSSETARCAGFCAGSSRCSLADSSSERVTYRSPASRASSGRTTSARMR